MQYDYEYLCQGLGHLTGLETRVYQCGKLLHHCSGNIFKPDISSLVAEAIENRQENVYYLETEELLAFGVIREISQSITIVIGPTCQVLPGENDAIAVLYKLGEPYSRLPELQTYFENMVPYPLENFLDILCFVNYSLNGDKLMASSLLGGKAPHAIEQQVANPTEQEKTYEAGIHNTYKMEREMLGYVSAGNLEAIRQFVGKPTTGRIGELASNVLRQRRNSCIVSATLISRAAVEGGLSTEVAFTLSDRYIQKAELLTSGAELAELGLEMLLDYTKRVAALKYGVDASVLADKVMRYIVSNIGRKISAVDIAKALDMNRSYLCERFKLETGQTIGECINTVHIEEAKRMLKTTTLSIAQISEYLAFSSQSYFQTVFKKSVGCTPKEYRGSVH